MTRTCPYNVRAPHVAVVEQMLLSVPLLKSHLLTAFDEEYAFVEKTARILSHRRKRPSRSSRLYLQGAVRPVGNTDAGTDVREVR